MRSRVRIPRQIRLLAERTGLTLSQWSRRGRPATLSPEEIGPLVVRVALESRAHALRQSASRRVLE
jgi:hypothetical protein